VPRSIYIVSLPFFGPGGKAVRDLKGGKVDFKVDKTGTLHSGIGRIGFGKDTIRENFLAFFEAIMKAKPPAGGAGLHLLRLSFHWVNPQQLCTNGIYIFTVVIG
jgi:hypothetical protein